MVDCDYCLICFKKLRNDKKEYNYKKEMDDNSQKVMLANWLLDRD